MTQYMLSVHHTGPYPDPTTPEAQEMFARVGAFNDEFEKSGSWVFVGGLQPLDTATKVDGRGDEAIVTDGAFSEAKEYLGGFWIVDLPDLDAALELAAGASKACGDEITVRPFQGE